MRSIGPKRGAAEGWDGLSRSDGSAAGRKTGPGRSRDLRRGEVLRPHPMSPVSGGAEGDVTSFELLDSRGGYRKRALPAMQQLL